jgi:hypothetical protein
MADSVFSRQDEELTSKGDHDGHEMIVSATQQLPANLKLGAPTKAEELKRLILFTLGTLLVYRPGNMSRLDLLALNRRTPSQRRNRRSVRIAKSVGAYLITSSARRRPNGSARQRRDPTSVEAAKGPSLILVLNHYKYIRCSPGKHLCTRTTAPG